MSLIAGQTAGPNGLTFFCGNSGVFGGCFRLKKNRTFLFSNFFFHGQRRALQLVCTNYNYLKQNRGKLNFIA